MPTGVALRDARQQLFAAAERILLRDGPAALTSRAVTTEAGVAKGVLHRHFADFDAFLAEFVLDAVARMDPRVAGLPAAAGTGTVAGNLTAALTALFESVAVALVPLVIARDELRARLRETWPAGVPVLTDAARLLGAYLTAERELGRLSDDADTQTLAAMLIGTCHLHYTGHDNTPPPVDDVARVVASVLSGAVPRL
ncbi:TetR family transcriptional regulator [Dactylosporangium sp. AC04546]|uniref:TetR/AcrR family transcriptional regulator n=1 Tax=Dactylosporangium sp. AC04546 TaxID=2862460 RepID=UPI001EE007C1|nr:TetR/AcrR family transcriptional regulator [Dactylosporangium sp. AC04546]WVK87435.1 TetR family transcriptional regulator [Dactylosporangium sp. AC04546]